MFPELMYPHWYDRCRLFSVLFEYEFLRKRSVKQDRLAREIGVKQGTISQLTNLQTYYRKVGYRMISRVIAHPKIDVAHEKQAVLLWLSTKDPGATRSRQDPLVVRHNARDLRQAALTWLKEATSDMLAAAVSNKKAGSSRKAPPPSSIIFHGQKSARVLCTRMLLKLEQQPGQRLMLMRYPTELSIPKSICKRYLGYELRSEEMEDVLALEVERRETFHAHLQLYGERGIHSSHGLTAYFTREELRHRLPLKDRRVQLEHWIDLLTEHAGRYEIGLVPQTPEIECEIKPGFQAILRGAPDADHWNDKRTRFGPRHLFWSEEMMIDLCVLEFENIWTAIPDNMRGPGALAWLRRLL